MIDIFLDENLVDKMKEKLGLQTSMDVCRFGSNLVGVEFKDF